MPGTKLSGKQLPLAELHVHIEGTAHPELALKKAREYNEDTSGYIENGRYVWSDFSRFLQNYDFVASLFRTPEDYIELAYDYYRRSALEGCIYCEMMISPDHARRMGVSYPTLVDAMVEGMNQARDETGIEGRIIAVGLRHAGPAAVEGAVKMVAANPHPMVTGFSMAGDERLFKTEEFSRAFKMAADAGLKLTTHAGEMCGAGSVRDSLDHLKVERIGHGVRAIDEPDLVKRLVDEKVSLEICPASNIAMNVFPDFASHPFGQLEKAGCKVTLNSDDPPHFFSSIAHEYEIAAEEFGYDDKALLGFTRNAIEAAFVDETTRAGLFEKIDNFALNEA